MKKKILVFAVFVIAVFLVSRNANAAASLVTPPLSSEATDTIGCSLVNVTDSPIEVTFFIYRSDGVLVDSDVTILGAGRAASLPIQGATFLHYCKFIVPRKTSVRAAIVITTSDGQVLAALPAE